MRGYFSGIAVALVFVAPAAAQVTAPVPRSAESLECSKQADARGLHGTERMAFRAQCKAEAAQPAQAAAAPPAAKPINPGFRCEGEILNTPLGRSACSDADVAKVSFRVNTAYRAMQTATDDAGRLKLQAQNEIWLSGMEAKCGETPAKACMIAALNVRLKQLGLAVQPAEAAVPKAPRPPAAAKSAAANVDAFSYCQTAVNLDRHGNTTIDRESSAAIAKVVRTDAFDWRCMDGAVFACELGASGRACQKMNASKLPTAAISAFCLESPNTGFVPMSVIGNSPASWKCVGTVPQISDSVALDKRGFMKGSWAMVEAPPRQPAAQEVGQPASAPLTQAEIDAFRSVIVNWSPPTGAPALDIRIRLKRDGTIDGAPEIVSTGTGAIFDAARNSEIRTVMQGQPFRMFKQESYDAWKDMIVTFEVPVGQAASPPPDACTAKYEAAKAAGAIGTISREDFIRICNISTASAMPASAQGPAARERVQ